MDVSSLNTQISEGARTLVHLQQHLHGLGTRADALLQSHLQSNRQYLTPSEDERTKQLLVSYWQARLALLGMVADFRAFERDGEQADSQQRDHVFLVGFTAALVLVNAGRFLREFCKPAPAIATKLNEPEPHFGIPAGVYNTVQKSLTSPINAWHLYHAARHFDRRQQELEACAAGDETLQQVLALAGRLIDRLRVSKREYAKARLSVDAGKLSRALTDHSFGRATGWVIEMCSRAIGKIGTVPGHRPALPLPIRDSLGAILEIGDVIITRKQYAATNYFLPGYWPHGILYLGDCETLQTLGLHEHENMLPRWERLLALDASDPRRVLEAMADGVRLRPILSAFSVDAVAVIRPRLTLHERVRGIARGLFHESKPYDFDFDFTRADRLVCTEVVYRSYEGIGGLEFPLTERLGRKTLAAEDLLRMALAGHGFQTVAVYLPGEANIAVNESAEEALRRSLNETSRQ